MICGGRLNIPFSVGLMLIDGRDNVNILGRLSRASSSALERHEERRKLQACFGPLLAHVYHGQMPSEIRPVFFVAFSVKHWSPLRNMDDRGK